MGQPSDNIPVLADWFGMLNRGWPICAIGNSDSHDPGDDAGYPRTYLDVGHSDPSALTDDAVKAAIRAQKAVISRGAWLDVTVDDGDVIWHSRNVPLLVRSMTLFSEAAKSSQLRATNMLSSESNGQLSS